MPPGEVLFITYRLYGTLPHTVLLDIQQKHQFLLKRFEEMDSVPHDRDEWRARYFLSIYKHIDTNIESVSWLGEQKIADIVKESIHFRDGKQFDVHAYCIMPNHVHLLVTNLSDSIPFHRVLGSMKANSAKKCNVELGRIGETFWASESYDHLVRTNKSFNRIIGYILNNPVKAGLAEAWEDWPHTYLKSGNAGGSPP